MSHSSVYETLITKIYFDKSLVGTRSRDHYTNTRYKITNLPLFKILKFLDIVIRITLWLQDRFHKTRWNFQYITSYLVTVYWWLIVGEPVTLGSQDHQHDLPEIISSIRKNTDLIVLPIVRINKATFWFNSPLRRRLISWWVVTDDKDDLGFIPSGFVTSSGRCPFLFSYRRFTLVASCSLWFRSSSMVPSQKLHAYIPNPLVLYKFSTGVFGKIPLHIVTPFYCSWTRFSSRRRIQCLSTTKVLMFYFYLNFNSIYQVVPLRFCVSTLRSLSLLIPFINTSKHDYFSCSYSDYIKLINRGDLEYIFKLGVSISTSDHPPQTQYPHLVSTCITTTGVSLPPQEWDK